eukprot:gene25926-gene861
MRMREVEVEGLPCTMSGSLTVCHKINCDGSWDWEGGGFEGVCERGDLTPGSVVAVSFTAMDAVYGAEIVMVKKYFESDLMFGGRFDDVLVVEGG